jgi:hypothetical protein
MQFSRHFATASAWTFSIKPIKELLSRYVTNADEWCDPFAGKNSPAKFTNDMNPERKAMFCMDAKDFCDQLEAPNLKGVLFDPPYSYRQVSEHYQSLGLKAKSIDTSYNFYTRVMDAIDPKLPVGSIAISFGWNTTGFCKKRGWEKIEIMIVSHGGHHNDTLITVEKKVSNVAATWRDL